MAIKLNVPPAATLVPPLIATLERRGVVGDPPVTLTVTLAWAVAPVEAWVAVTVMTAVPALTPVT